MLEAIPSGLVTLVAFLAMLALLVLVHELGHFLTAVWLGIKVEEFGFGYPPRALVLFERDGVKYTLNWLPIGGFVRFGGEGEQIYGVGSLSAASPWRKILVLVAGPLMNLVLAIAIFAALFLLRGVPTVFDGAVIDTVYPGTPAAAAGFQSGDLLIEIDGRPIGTELERIRHAAQANPGQPIVAVVERAGTRVTLTVTPGPWEYNGSSSPVGFGFSYGPNVRSVPASLPDALGAGVTHTFQVLARFIDGLSQLLKGLLGLNPMPAGGVAGVVGIARGTGEVIQRDGLLGFWQWTALISLNLFLVNLLPIPALDGSHIMFSLIELARRGKKIPPEREAMVHAIGFMMLMGLMLIITVSDVAQWIGGAPVLGGG
ncbi:MAG TPA: M50 family metallopeptidase [Roseiflexaceae bacterium]|nr:M50 family metallopeptidase [Roseiflexaceae bacterium]